MTTLRITADKIQAGDETTIAGVPVTVTRSAFAGFARMVTVVGPGGWSSHLYIEPDMIVTVEREVAA